MEEARTLQQILSTLEEGAKYRHKKSGKIYTLLFAGIREATLAPEAIYQCPTTDIRWIRPMDEFVERFERV